MGSRIQRAFVGYGKGCAFQGMFSGKLVKNFNQGSEMTGFKSLIRILIKDTGTDWKVAKNEVVKSVKNIVIVQVSGDGDWDSGDLDYNKVRSGWI